MSTGVRYLWDLLMPSTCAVCDAPGAVLCDSCEGELRISPVHRSIPVGGGRLPVFSGGTFEGAAARLLRVAKRDGRPRLVRRLAPHLRAALVEAGCSDDALLGERLVVVPVPTRASSYRDRGFDLVSVLVRAAGVHPRRMLRWQRKQRDQRRLGRVARAENLAGSMRAVHEAEAAVILADDVVTSAATLAEAHRALTVAGHRVVAAATALSTAETARPWIP